jgi:aspartate/methionine/tyrosine aminotransferase
MHWAKTRPAARFDLATSNVLGCSLDDLEGARDALVLSGSNENGYAPLVDAIARQYGVDRSQVTTAPGASGANFQVCAALLEPGDEVIVERPGYDPLLGAPRLLGAHTVRVDRLLADGFALDPDRIRAALTPKTRLIVVTSPHNPTGALTTAARLEEIGRIAAANGAYVLVDEVYLDVVDTAPRPAALLGERFISTSSLTKSYGLASLRCGWALASPEVAERIRRARDVIDGTGSIVAERLATLAFAQLDQLSARARAILETNRQLVMAFLRSRTELEYLEPAGGTVVFPRLRGVADTTEFADFLFRELETAVVPGRFFEAPSHFRIGFGCPKETVEHGLAALGEGLNAYARQASAHSARATNVRAY